MQMEEIKINTLAIVTQHLGTGSINIFGLPFSGKDTHGNELASLLGGVLISGGDILRSDVGPQHIKDRIAKGYLAPSDEYIEIITPYLGQEKYASMPLILSSVGRWSGEEVSIVAAAKSAGHPLKAVIYLQVAEEEIFRRWELAERGRHDDGDKAVLQHRFNEFKDKTMPVIDYYKAQGLLIEIDGTPSIDDVTTDILQKLAAHLAK
jgi:adenylate kinase